MATQAKTDSLPVTSPFGVAVYPKLNAPDFKFNEAGEFKVDLRLDPADKEVKAFLKRLKDYADHAYTELCNSMEIEDDDDMPARAALPIKKETDDEGAKTGLVLVRFKMKHKITKRSTGETWTQRPKLFDSKMQPMAEAVGGGSILRVSAEAVPFYTAMIGAGITLRLQGVQVKELVEFTGGRSPEGMGFSEVDDGFESTGAPADEDNGIRPASDDLEDY